jgi:hypothetical protein
VSAAGLRSALALAGLWAAAMAGCGGDLAGGAAPGATGGGVSTDGAPPSGVAVGTGASGAGGGGDSSIGTGGYAGGSWVDRTARTAADRLDWRHVASDATGTRLVAVASVGGPNPVANANIWTSSDAGASWTNRTAGTDASGQRWAWVASDATGARLVAATTPATNGQTADVWTSSDAGATWIKRASIDPLFGRSVVASDATGTRLALAVGDVWTSPDGGITWTDQTLATPGGLAYCYALASDATGDRLVAIASPPGGAADVWTSADAGQTWTNRTQGTAGAGQYWWDLASDATGAHLVAVSRGTAQDQTGDVWTSADFGATWINGTNGAAGANQPFAAAASDATGTNLVAAGASGIWRSADAGASWTNETALTAAYGQEWVSVAADAAGTHLVALSNSNPGIGLCCMGSIWTRVVP